MTLALISKHLASQVKYGLFSVLMTCNSLSDFSHFSFWFAFPMIVPKMFKFRFFQLMRGSSACDLVGVVRPCVLSSFKRKSEAFFENLNIFKGFLN